MNKSSNPTEDFIHTAFFTYVANNSNDLTRTFSVDYLLCSAFSSSLQGGLAL